MTARTQTALALLSPVPAAAALSVVIALDLDHFLLGVAACAYGAAWLKFLQALSQPAVARKIQALTGTLRMGGRR